MINTRIDDKEVSWKVLDIPTYGTITAPADKQAHPAVVLIAGSGPTDRNWCSPLLPGTNGSAKLLSEALASQGYITLRYDKAGSGPHVRENVPKLIGKISMQSHVEEVTGAVEAILSEKNVDKSSLFVLTNSEGAIHAVNYQLQTKNNRFKGLVLTGAPGRTIGDVSRSQVFAQVRVLPNSETIMKNYDAAVAQFLASKPITTDASLPEGLKLLLNSLENPANLPFTRELWTYSLPEYVSKVSEPVLVVIGKKDVQIDWKADGVLLEKATAKQPAVTFVYPENSNHVLKHEEAPIEKLNAQSAALGYNAPGAELDMEATNAIFDWLRKQF